MTKRKNKTQHACALEINHIGILIIGESGSGKTSLVMGLLEKAKLKGHEAFLIADDQVYLENVAYRLEASAPEAIAGLIEIYGYGIIKTAYKKSTDLALVIQIIEDDKVERMPEQKFWRYENIKRPLLKVPKHHENQAIRIIYAWLTENSALHLSSKN